MTDRIDTEILSKALKTFTEWASKTIPGFYMYLSSVQERLGASSVDDVIFKTFLNPQIFYNAVMEDIGSPIVANSYLYLLISSFINFFKLPMSAAEFVKIMRKGDWKEWEKKIMHVTELLRGKV
ncbi:MAG: hypothetical protein QXK94_04320 [Candidatus Jordarchaeales archaeon]